MCYILVMGVTFEELKQQQKDHFRARWEDDQLVMEPHCWCGEPLDEQYTCAACGHKCRCTFVACQDAESLAAVKRLFQENPDFHSFEVAPVER